MFKIWAIIIVVGFFLFLGISHLFKEEVRYRIGVAKKIVKTIKKEKNVTFSRGFEVLSKEVKRLNKKESNGSISN